MRFIAGDGAAWNPSCGGRWAHATFKAVGTIKVSPHRPISGPVKTLRLKREHRRWYVIVTAELQPSPLPATGRSVGVDLGVARFLTTSDGEVVSNPRILDATGDRVLEVQRRKDRAKFGSGNRKRLIRRMARECRKVGNQRRDFHHKTARALINQCDAIALEKLNVMAMTKRPAPRPDPDRPGGYLPNMATAKAGLAKSILDAGWTQFANILVAKAEEAGRSVIFVNPAYTSINCHLCGARCIRPQQDTVICPAHGPMDADMNGAINIASRAGLGSGQAAHAA